MKIKAVIFDYNRTLVEGEDTPSKLFPEVLNILQTLKERNIKMAVVSAGGDSPEKRYQEFEQLKLREHGISVFKVVSKGESKDLQPMLDEFKVTGDMCLVVGDRIKKEIIEGNKVGATTVWFKNGKFAEEGPETPEEEPDYTIKSLTELIPLLDSLNE